MTDVQERVLQIATILLNDNRGKFSEWDSDLAEMREETTIACCTRFLKAFGLNYSDFFIGTIRKRGAKK